MEQEEVHLIILDIMMPQMDGLKATFAIRESKNIPIIMLSAKSEDTDKILGLTIGADDYVTKPFNPLELVARVKSQLRRYTHLGNYTAREDASNEATNRATRKAPVWDWPSPKASWNCREGGWPSSWTAICSK